MLHRSMKAGENLVASKTDTRRPRANIPCNDIIIIIIKMLLNNDQRNSSDKSAIPKKYGVPRLRCRERWSCLDQRRIQELSGGEPGRTGVHCSGTKPLVKSLGEAEVKCYVQMLTLSRCRLLLGRKQDSWAVWLLRNVGKERGRTVCLRLESAKVNEVVCTQQCCLYSIISTYCYSC